MAVIRRSKSATLFRYLVTPTLLLCAIFRKPLFQWIAVGAAAIWLISELWMAIAARQKKPRKKELQALDQIRTTPIDLPKGEAPEMPERDLFLIRQINCRITEQLKHSYPMVAWIWQPRPSVDELNSGGTWRIQLSNADPFNYGDVEIAKTGKLTITLLQAVPLSETSGTKAIQTSEPEDLRDDEILDRVDAKTWYLGHGEKIIAEMIDDLNSQGHKQLLIKDDGSVIITASGKNQVVESIVDFPPRMVWEEFCQLLSEDDITASVQPEGLSLVW